MLLMPFDVKGHSQWLLNGVMVVVFFGDNLLLARREAMVTEAGFCVDRARVFRRRGETARSARWLAKAARYRQELARLS